MRYALLIVALLPALASAQNLRQLTRATATTGVNDSALVLVSDSASRTRAASIAELKTVFGATVTDTVRAVMFDSVKATRLLVGNGTAGAPSLSFLGDRNTGFYQQANNDFITASLGGTRGFAWGANGGHFQSISYSSGAVAAPTYSWNNDANTGMYSFGADTLGFATGGAHSLRLSGGAAVTLSGGAGNMTIQAGTGNSRTMTLQTTTSAGTAKNTLVLGADSSVTLLDGAQLRIGGTNIAYTGDNTFVSADIKIQGKSMLRVTNSVVTFGADQAVSRLDWFQAPPTQKQTILARADTLTLLANSGVGSGAFGIQIGPLAATGAGDVAVCIKTDSVLTKGATCGSSTAKIKTDIRPLGDLAVSQTMALRPVSYSYVPGFYGERAEYGLIAEEVAKVDPRFAFYAEQDQTLANGEQVRKGDAINVNDRAVMAVLIATVQEQQRQIEALKAEVTALKKP